MHWFREYQSSVFAAVAAVAAVAAIAAMVSIGSVVSIALKKLEPYMKIQSFNE